jgi:hypothetical protein
MDDTASPLPPLPLTARRAGRTLGLAIAAGAVSGFLAGGVGGRLFMFVLARLNPEETGVKTDDGFEMGQFTASGTANLLAITTVIGILGGLVFLALRGLRFGPGWFRVLSMPVGATIVVGSMLVHSDGVDFYLLEPVELAVAMTLAVPFLYTLLVAGLLDRWLGDAPGVWQAMPAVVPWLARAALTALAVVVLVDLVSTIDDIVHPFQFG